MENTKLDNLRYTKEHEWAMREGAELLIGITQFAVDQLGDITLVNTDVREGDAVTAGKAFGTVESVKTLSDLYAPVSGTITRVNIQLESKPELINEDCYGSGWMVAILPSDAQAVDQLLSKADYDLLTTP